MRLPLLFAAAVASGGWALSEARPPRPRPFVSRLKVELAPDPVPEPVRQARAAPIVRPSLPPVRVEPPPPRVATLAGRVVDADEQPRAGVKVHLDIDGVCIELTADLDGRFKLSVAPGRYDINAYDDDNHESPNVAVNVESGEQVRDLRLVLPLPPPPLREVDRLDELDE
jgi:hypothetical protein